VNSDLLDLDAATYAEMLGQVLADFPRLAIAAATLRQVRTASVNDWSGVCRTRTSFHEGPRMAGLEIFDRIGGGDSFVSGLTYGLLAGFDVGTALAFGIAHGALVMTTPGDTSMATLAEVRRLAAGQRGGRGRAQRQRREQDGLVGVVEIRFTRQVDAAGVMSGASSCHQPPFLR